jgi:hypothetical protein
MGSPPSESGVEPGDPVRDLNDTERFVLGPVSGAEVRSFFSAYVRDPLDSPIASILFRAGRIDVVWGVALEDGREVVIKSHRMPVEVDAITAAREAQKVLRAADFPCPEPLSGPDEIDGRVLTLETLMGEGETPDGRDPGNRRLLAEGLARSIALLRGRPDLLHGVGQGPSWCRYQQGPWPVPHDPIVDFSSTPHGYAWLDKFAAAAGSQILDHRGAGKVVVGHADWYSGNTAVADGVLVATFDWELVTDAEAVIAGFTAACFAASSTRGGGLSTPEEVTAFLRDYDAQRGAPLTAHEQRAAVGAAAWILAFNARWDLGMHEPGQAEGATLALVRERQDDYLTLSW